MISEQKLQKDIIDLLENKGYTTFKVITANKAGISDIIACSPTGRFIAIEVKAPGKLKEVSKLQQRFLDKIKVRSGAAILADDIQTVKNFLGI